MTQEFRYRGLLIQPLLGLRVVDDHRLPVDDGPSTRHTPADRPCSTHRQNRGRFTVGRHFARQITLDPINLRVNRVAKSRSVLSDNIPTRAGCPSASWQ